MPRTYTAVHHSIWQDDEWRDLSPAAQHLYFVLLTAPGLSFCGVGDWRPRRLLPLSRGWRMNDFNAAADELSQNLLIIVDQVSEEYLIRSFLRHDGVMQHNKTCVSAMKAHAQVSSNQIRGVVVNELRRLKDEFPEWACWSHPEVKGVLKRRALDPGVAPRLAPTQGLKQGGASPSASPPVRPPSTPGPTPRPSDTPTGVSDQEPAGETDDLPLPPDFTPTDDHKQRVHELGVDLKDALEDFHLWAESEGITSRSWNARFTQFIKRRAKFAENDAARTPHSGGTKPTTSNKVREGIALAERLAAEEADTENVVPIRPQIEGA